MNAGEQATANQPVEAAAPRRNRDAGTATAATEESSPSQIAAAVMETGHRTRGFPSARELVALQRSAGNGSVAQLVKNLRSPVTVQRHPPSTTDEWEGINHSPEMLVTGGHGTEAGLRNIIRMAFSDDIGASELDRQWVTSPVFAAWYLRGLQGVVELELAAGNPAASGPPILRGGPLNELMSRNTRRGRQLTEQMVAALDAAMQIMQQRAANRRPPQPGEIQSAGRSSEAGRAAINNLAQANPQTVPALASTRSPSTPPAGGPTPSGAALQYRTPFRQLPANDDATLPWPQQPAAVAQSGRGRAARIAAQSPGPSRPTNNSHSDRPRASASQGGSDDNNLLGGGSSDTNTGEFSTGAPTSTTANPAEGPYVTDATRIRGVRRASAMTRTEREAVHDVRRIQGAVRRYRLQQTEQQAEAQVSAERRAAAAARRQPQVHGQEPVEDEGSGPLSQAERDVRVGRRMQQNADLEPNQIAAADMIRRGRTLIERSRRRFVSESVQRAQARALRNVATQEGGQHNAQSSPAGHELQQAAADQGLPPIVQDELERRGGQLISQAGAAQHPGGRRGRR